MYLHHDTFGVCIVTDFDYLSPLIKLKSSEDTVVRITCIQKAYDGIGSDSLSLDNYFHYDLSVKIIAEGLRFNSGFSWKLSPGGEDFTLHFGMAIHALYPPLQLFLNDFKSKDVIMVNNSQEPVISSVTIDELDSLEDEDVVLETTCFKVLKKELAFVVQRKNGWFFIHSDCLIMNIEKVSQTDWNHYWVVEIAAIDGISRPLELSISKDEKMGLASFQSHINYAEYCKVQGIFDSTIYKARSIKLKEVVNQTIEEINFFD